MNTEPEKPHKPSLTSLFEELSERVQPTIVDDSAAALEAALQAERDHRREERFYWIFVCTVLFDAVAFQNIGIAGVLVLVVFELIFLIGIADRLGVDRVVILLEGAFAEFRARFRYWK